MTGGEAVRIESVSHTRVEIALHETFRTAIRSTDSIAALRVEIRAGERVGVGYATATPAITGDTVEGIEAHLDAVVIPYLLGRDIVDRQGEARDRDEAQSLLPTGVQSDVELGVPGYVLGMRSDALFGIPSRVYEDWTKQCSSGTAGIDLALHDLVFHGSQSTRASGSSSFSSAAEPKLATSVTIGAGSIEDMVATAHRRVAAGFRVVKAKLGADPVNDAQRLIALAQALGAIGHPNAHGMVQYGSIQHGAVQRGSVQHGVVQYGSIQHGAVQRGSVQQGAVQLWVDANQGWTVARALEIFDAALDAHVVLGVFEQPTPAADLDGLREVRLGVQQRCLARGLAGVPVVADESARTLADVDRIIAVGAADVINVKFMKFGGPTGSGIAVAKARAAGLGVLVGSMMEHPHSVAAAVRFASSLGGVHDLDAGWWAQDTSPLTYADGFVSVAAR